MKMEDMENQIDMFCDMDRFFGIRGSLNKFPRMKI